MRLLAARCHWPLITAWLLVMVLSARWAPAADPAPAAPVAPAPPAGSWSLAAVFAQVPPLKHDYAGRLPMITWPPFTPDLQDKSFAQKQPLAPEVYRELARRGLTQRLPLNPDYIPMAQAIAAAGAAVIFVEGNGGAGPYAEGPDPLHHLPADYVRAKDEEHFPCPMLFAGWAKAAERTRATLRRYREAGVPVTAAWLDWETLPWGAPEEYRQAAACPRCRECLPKAALASYEGFRHYIGPLRAELFSTYLAAPIREAYPACSVTDWSAVISTPERPTSSVWANRQMMPRGLGLCTAANPVAYGNDIYYSYHWQKDWNWPLDVAHMDRLYTQIMLTQASHTAENLLRWAPGTPVIPWVCRYCPDAEDEHVPILSRARYREILRHLWLRGATSMQIFNEPRPKHPTIAVEEVADAVAIYDELLAFRPFLEDGVVMNTAVPDAHEEGAIWSGLRLADSALVRVFTMHAEPVTCTLTPFPGGPAVELPAPPAGATYRLTRAGATITVTPEPAAP